MARSPIVEVIIRAKDLASNVVKGFERNLKATVATAKHVAKGLLAIGAAAVGTVVALQRLGVRGAAVNGVKATFARLTGDETAALNLFREAAGGTISDMDLMTRHNQALALGAARSTDQFGRMVGIAKALGKSLGVDATYALESLTTGIGRQSKLFLDNIGIIVTAEEAQNKYAASLGRSANTLTDLEKKEAFRVEALRQGEELVKTLTATTDRGAEAAQRFAAQWANIKDQFALFIATSPAVANFMDGLSLVLGELAGRSARVQGEMLSLANASLGALTHRAEEYAHALSTAADATRTIDERNRRLKELGVTDVEAQQLLDYINGRIRMMELIGKAADAGGGGGGLTAPSKLKGTTAELTALFDAITKTDAALTKAKLDAKLAAPGEKAEEAAKKVRELADELVRLNALAGPFGGREGLGLALGQVSPLTPGLLGPRTGPGAADAFRRKRYSLVPGMMPGTERGLPFGDTLKPLVAPQLDKAEDRFQQTAGIVASTMGDMAAAAIRGTGSVSASVLSMIGNILQGVTKSPLLGGVLGGVFAIGAALFGRSERPRVVVDDYGAAAERKMREADKRPIRITTIVESGGRPIAEIERELYDRQERDEVVRFPVGGGLGR